MGARDRSRSPPASAVAQDGSLAQGRTAVLGKREYTLDSPQLGVLRDSSGLSPAELRSRLKEDGYIFVRGLLPAAPIRAAKLRILEHLRSQGLLAEGSPLEDGIVGAAHGSDQGRLRGAEELCETAPIQALLNHDALHGFFSELFGKPALTYDNKWLRVVRKGESTGFHMDTVYMGKLETENLLTCWVPLMPVPLELGGLAVSRGSSSDPGFARVRETYGRLDLDSGDVGGTGWFSEDPEEVSHFGGRLETAEFEPGDVVVFTMHTMHGSCVNRTDRWRLSFDVRWQPADEPVDPRWVRDSKGQIPGPRSRWGLHRNDRKEFPRTMEMAKKDWGLSKY